MTQPDRKHELTIQLEDALHDAVNMARLTDEFLNRALGFDALKGEQAPIYKGDARLLLWACSKTSDMAERCQDLFRRIDAAKVAAIRNTLAEGGQS